MARGRDDVDTEVVAGGALAAHQVSRRLPGGLQCSIAFEFDHESNPKEREKGPKAGEVGDDQVAVGDSVS